MNQGTCTVATCEWMKKRAALTAGKTSSATSSVMDVVDHGIRIVELQKEVRAGSAFLFFDVLDSHFQQVRLLEAALKRSRQLFMQATPVQTGERALCTLSVLTVTFLQELHHQ